MRQGVQALEELPVKMKPRGKLASHVTAEAVRSLKGMVTPLGGDDVIPEPRYLASWWKTVTYALEAVDTTCDVEHLPRSTLERIGHVLLGQAAWELVCRRPFIDWAGFKKVVEDRFGIGEEHQRELFLQLNRAAGEDGCEFIRRVEDTRIRLGFNEGEALMKAWS